MGGEGGGAQSFPAILCAKGVTAYMEGKATGQEASQAGIQCEKKSGVRPILRHVVSPDTIAEAKPVT